jgi:hypothetical protein
MIFNLSTEIETCDIYITTYLYYNITKIINLGQRRSLFLMWGQVTPGALLEEV